MSEQLFEPAAESENMPSLLNEPLLQKYNPSQQRVLKSVSQNPQAPTGSDQLAQKSFPQEPDLNTAKRKLAGTLSAMKEKLADDKLEIVNSSAKVGHRGEGTKAEYYLREITMVLVDQTGQPIEIPPFTIDLFNPRLVRDWGFKKDLILAGLSQSNRELFESEYKRLYVLWVNGKLPTVTDLNRVIEIAAMVALNHKSGIQK